MFLIGVLAAHLQAKAPERVPAEAAAGNGSTVQPVSRS